MKRVTGFFTSILGISLVLLVPAVVFWQQQKIFDWWKLRNYHPSAQVLEMASATTMNDYTRKVFYVNNPKVEDKAAFNTSCNGNEQTIVLGCFISHKGIYIYDVKDPRLQGVEEVTAAHETLHAVYDRLPTKEKNRVNKMVTAAFAQMSDQRLKDTIEQYRKKDPSVVPNELHSILGTEVRTLPPELETYYKQYFTDRSRIVALSEQYEQTFTERDNKIQGYDNQLAALKPAIENGEAGLRSQLAVLQTQKQQLDAYAARGDIKSYNAGIPGYNAKVAAYNKQLGQVRTNIDSYNNIVQLRNDLAAEEKELVQAIDSRLPAAQ